MQIRTLKQFAIAGVLASVVAACADAPTAEPDVMGLRAGRVLNNPPIIGPAGTISFTEEKIVVCKVFTGSLLSYPSANFEAVFTGTANATVNFDLDNGECADLGFFGGAGVDVTVTETAIANYSTSFTTQLATASGGVTSLGPISAPTAGYQASGSAFGTRTGFPATGTRFVFTNAYQPPAGCTFTLGYWKTHSDRGPAPYDAGWGAIGALEEDTPFYSSGKTWYQLFWTPVRGSAYVALAHQYMAAKLNILNGSSTTSAVAAAIAAAEAYFSTGTGNISGLATLLDEYNNGIIGPGHCGQ